MMSMNLSDIAILKIQGSDYGCISNLISEKKRKKRNITKRKSLLSHFKMFKEILTFGDIEIEKKKKKLTKIGFLLF